MKQLIITIIFMVAAFHMDAQPGVWGWLQKTMSAQQTQNIAYKYKLSVFDASDVIQKGNQIDGKIIKNGRDFIDSNTSGITLCKADMFLRIYFDTREAVVCNYKKVGTKFKVPLNQSFGIVVSDTMIMKHSKVNVDTVKDKNNYIVDIDLRGAETMVDHIKIWIAKGTLMVDRMLYSYSPPEELMGQQNAPGRYEYLLYDMRQPDQNVPEISSFLSYKKNLPVLSAAYAGYKVTNLK